MYFSTFLRLIVSPLITLAAAQAAATRSDPQRSVNINTEKQMLRVKCCESNTANQSLRTKCCESNAGRGAAHVPGRRESADEQTSKKSRQRWRR